MQLEPGTLVMTSTMRAFDGLLIRQTAVNRTSLHRIRVPPHSVSLLISSSRYAAQFVDGCKLTRDRCVILQEGAEMELIAHPESSWMLITLSGVGMTGATTPRESRSISLHAGAWLTNPSMTMSIALRDEAISALFGVGSSTAVWRTIRLATRILHDAAELTIDAPTRSVMRDDRAPRLLAVERARRYIEAHLSDPIRLADLCTHAHSQARSLEYGFRELVCLSPMSYIRMLRLGEVRSQLKGTSEKRSISEIALDAGFSHLSQFVVDYKRVFGETPSATRRSVRLAKAGAETESRNAFSLQSLPQLLAMGSPGSA